MKLIFACGLKGEIGKDNKLPWNLPRDMSHFVRETKGACVIMGRNTYHSLPKGMSVLPGRINIIVSSNPSKVLDEFNKRSKKPMKRNGAQFYIVSSLEEAQKMCKDKFSDRDAYIIGGAQLYKYALENDMVTEVVRTLINEYFEADTFLDISDLLKEKFNRVREQFFMPDKENAHNILFQWWKRI